MYTEVATIFAIFLAQSFSTYVKPATFLDSQLAKGHWVEKGEGVSGSDLLFEGGWLWTSSGNLIATHICRAKTRSFPDVTIEPGELLNGTCYISGEPTDNNPSGVTNYENYQVLVKSKGDGYEWETFDKLSGFIKHGTVIGGIGAHYEPIMICRKVFNGTAGELRTSKAVLGKFNAKDGLCFYEQEIGTKIKYDLTYATENFQLLVLRVSFEEWNYIIL